VMKTKMLLVLIAVLLFSALNTAQAKITVKGPTKKNLTKDSFCPAKDGYNFLDPQPPTYLPPPSEKSALFKELKGGDVTFKGFTFKKGAALSGTLTIDDYHSKFLGTHNSGGQIKARYKKGAGDPNNLRWVQLVNSQMPINKPPEKYPIIDPVPEDEPNTTSPDPNKYRPFYWNEEEIGRYTGGKTFDLKFSDLSSRYHPPTSFEIWTGDLYITSWDGNTPGTVTFHDGIQWGWVGGCINFSDPNWIDHFWDTFFSSPTTTGTDKVTLDFTGANGTIENVITDIPGTVTTPGGNCIEIEWDEPLEPNTPISIKFSTAYQSLDFTGGIWLLEEVDVDIIEPCDVNLTKAGPPFEAYSLEVVDSDYPGTASWPGTGTGYDYGHWYHYPNTGWMNVWFDNRPFDYTGSSPIKIKMTIGPLDPELPYSATVVAGYSTNLWSYLGNDHPPLPGDVPMPYNESDYIYREEALPAFDGTGIEPQEIHTEITAWDYNPQWTCVSVKGENLKITYGLSDYSEPYDPPLAGADFEVDGTIDEYDLDLFCQEWLRQGHKYESDLNGDGIVNLRDFAIVAAKWRQSLKATNPYPPDGAADMPVSMVLSWTPGIGAIGHDIYLGTVFEDVNDANWFNPLGVYMGSQKEEFYSVELMPDMPYFWRIDETGETESDPQKGDVWNFTTGIMP